LLKYEDTGKTVRVITEELVEADAHALEQLLRLAVMGHFRFPQPF
jgi:hypothetical protein